jgi:hypothetical protein
MVKEKEMSVVHVDGTVEVEVDVLDYLGDIGTGDLIEEIEYRGYHVTDNGFVDELTKEDLYTLLDFLDRAKLGTEEWNIRQKLAYVLDQKDL